MTIKSHLLAAAVAAAGPAAAAEPVFSELPPQTRDLEVYAWSARPVLLFAPSADDPDYVAQMSAFRAAESALHDRDVVVLSDTAPDVAGALREGFRPDGFLMVLVGKDGGEKLQTRTPISAEDLLATIDAMPMRRAGQ